MRKHHCSDITFIELPVPWMHAKPDVQKAYATVRNWPSRASAFCSLAGTLVRPDAEEAAELVRPPGRRLPAAPRQRPSSGERRSALEERLVPFRREPPFRHHAPEELHDDRPRGLGLTVVHFGVV